MLKEGEERRLYIGLDETNHGRYPEIIVAVSSFIEADANAPRLYGRHRMNEGELMRYLANEGRDFRYLKAEKGDIPREKHQLVEAAPLLIEQLVKALQKRGERISGIDVILDGEVRTKDLNELHNNLFGLRVKRKIRTVCIEPYPKSERYPYRYPRILVAADSVAHFLRKGLENICAEQKLVRMVG